MVLVCSFSRHQRCVDSGDLFWFLLDYFIKRRIKSQNKMYSNTRIQLALCKVWNKGEPIPKRWLKISECESRIDVYVFVYIIIHWLSYWAFEQSTKSHNVFRQLHDCHDDIQSILFCGCVWMIHSYGPRWTCSFQIVDSIRRRTKK